MKKKERKKRDKRTERSVDEIGTVYETEMGVS